MIRYPLLCEHGHAFEGWFGSSSDFEDQMARGLLECPLCASRAVRKEITAPAVAGTKRTRREPDEARKQAMMMEALNKVRLHVEENFEDVGDAFAREARAIHEGRAERRDIYGEATPQEARALIEDGINVAPLPPAPVKRRLN